MDQQAAYERVDLERLGQSGDAPRTETERAVGSAEVRPGQSQHFRWPIILLSVFLCIVQALIVILVGNAASTVHIMSTLIPVLGFAALMLLLLVVNPVLKVVFRNVVRPLNRVELMAVFSAMLVTSGVSMFGLTDQLLPLIATPYNPSWNTEQSPWRTSVHPHLNPSLYITTPENAPYPERASAVAMILALEEQIRTAAKPQNGPAVLSLEEEQASLTAVKNVRSVLEGGKGHWNEIDAALNNLSTTLSRLNHLNVNEFNQLRDTTRKTLAYNNPANDLGKFRSGSIPPPPNTDFTASWNYYIGVFRNIPWGTWLRPLSFWMILIFACYGMFYSLTYLVLDYWTKRDKLIFPLAKLPEALLPEDRERGGLLPSSLTNAGFWFGFAIPFLILSYNAMANALWLPGFTAIGLGLDANLFTNMFKDSVLEGLQGYSDWPTNALIIFTAIGMSFLLPTEVSFSIWFYFILGKLTILAATWAGYGRTGQDLPADWLWKTNIVTSLAAGGILLFSSISLFRCAEEFIRAAWTRRGLERLRLLWPVVGLTICTTIVILWLWWNWKWTPDALIWAVVFAAFLVLLTLGLMRIVAESGVYWIQVFGGSFFHYYQTLGLGSVFKPALLGPLMPIYSVLFLELKTFMAPNVLNAARLREDVGGSRFKYHFNIWLCIVVSVVVSLGTTIYIAHERGADRMSSWFYQHAPQGVMNNMASAITTLPEFQAGDAACYGAGAGWVALTMFLRRSIFWFPHPIGFIMLINPLIAPLWFSFFLGWAAKSLVVRYGGKMTFDTVRLIFIGLIMGELIAVVFWPLLGLILGVSFGQITLNRN